MEAASISTENPAARVAHFSARFPAFRSRLGAGSLSERMGKRLAGVHPVVVFPGWDAPLLRGSCFDHRCGRCDLHRDDPPTGRSRRGGQRPAEWLAERRTATLNDLSFVGSEISGGIVLPILVGLLAIGFAIRRHWLLAAFVIFGVALESATYRTSQFVAENGLTSPDSKACRRTRASHPDMSPRRSPSTRGSRSCSPLE